MRAFSIYSVENLNLNSEIANGVSTLTELEVRILEFEKNWWRFAGAKESAIRELFNLNPPAYYQLLNNLIDRPDALLASPMLVKRLRRIREARRA